MKQFVKYIMALLAVVFITTVVAGIAWASQTSEGQVVAVQDWKVFIRTSTNEAVSFLPNWVKEGNSWVPSRPARNIISALESGEVVRVSWTLDEREGCRRIDAIQVISAQDGLIRGVVASSGASQLVMSQEQ